MQFNKTEFALPLLGACLASSFVLTPHDAHAESDGTEPSTPVAPIDAPAAALDPAPASAKQAVAASPADPPPPAAAPDNTPPPAAAPEVTAPVPVVPLGTTPPVPVVPLGTTQLVAVAPINTEPPVPVASFPEGPIVAPEPVNAEAIPTTALSTPPMMAPPTPAGLQEPPGDNGPSNRKAKDRHFGAMLNVGLPEGVLTSFVYQPIGYVRMNVGLGFNAISPSVNVGVSGHPLGYGWGPSLSVNYGHYFEGDASGLVEMLSGPIETDVTPMKNVGYDYVNFRLGLEYGGDRFVFFTRGGVSWIRTEIHGLNELFEAEAGDDSGTTSITISQDPVLSVWAPSFTLGMIVRL